MPIDTDIEVRDETGIGSQWLGNLLPPIAFLLQLEAGYMLVPRACRTGDLLPVHLANVGALLLALGGMALALRQWQRWGHGWPPDGPGPESRSRFMAALGVLVSAGFILVILALWLPTFWLHPCQ